MTMINCKECADFLMAYLDGDLPAAQKEAFETHLHLCPPCMRYIETYMQTMAMARAAHTPKTAPTSALPEEMVKAIMASMAGQHAAARKPGQPDKGAQGGGGCGCGCPH